MKTYYKIVKNIDGVFTSLTNAPFLTLSYEIGKTTRPKIEYTNLMVFDDLDNVKDFWNDCGYHRDKHRDWGTGYVDMDSDLVYPACEILECEVTNPLTTGLFAYYFADLQYLSEAALLAHYNQSYTNLIRQKDPPFGTIFCNSVTPTKVIDWN